MIKITKYSDVTSVEGTIETQQEMEMVAHAIDTQHVSTTDDKGNPAILVSVAPDPSQRIGHNDKRYLEGIGSIHLWLTQGTRVSYFVHHEGLADTPTCRTTDAHATEGATNTK